MFKCIIAIIVAVCLGLALAGRVPESDIQGAMSNAFKSGLEKFGGAARQGSEKDQLQGAMHNAFVRGMETFGGKRVKRSEPDPTAQAQQSAKDLINLWNSRAAN